MRYLSPTDNEPPLAGQAATLLAHFANPRQLGRVVAAAMMLALSACASTGPDVHGIVRASDEAQWPADLPTMRPYANVPDWISIAEPGDLSAVAQVAVFASLESPGMLEVGGGGLEGESFYEFTKEGCALALRQHLDSEIDLEFSGDDAASTSAVLAHYVGNAYSPGAVHPVTWHVNNHASMMESLAIAVVDSEGRRVVAIARAFGELRLFVYVELACAPGLSTEDVFADLVGPNVSLEMFG